MKPAHMQDVSRLPTKCNIADLTAQDTGIGGFILTFTCTPNFRVTVFSMSLVKCLRPESVFRCVIYQACPCRPQVCFLKMNAVGFEGNGITLLPQSHS